MENEPQILSRDELHDMMKSEESFHLVEVLPEESFEEFHLPGAVHLPGDEMRSRAPDVIPDKDATVVVYCANPACQASDRAARLLVEMGYTDVRDYRGGKQHWREGGFPVEESESAAPAAAGA